MHRVGGPRRGFDLAWRIVERRGAARPPTIKARSSKKRRLPRLDPRPKQVKAGFQPHELPEAANDSDEPAPFMPNAFRGDTSPLIRFYPYEQATHLEVAVHVFVAALMALWLVVYFQVFDC